MHAVGRGVISRRVGYRLTIGRAESSAYLQLRVERFHGFEGLALCHVYHMDGAEELFSIGAPRRVNTVPVTECGEDPGLIED
jgi:hypothetical protein